MRGFCVEEWWVGGEVVGFRVLAPDGGTAWSVLYGDGTPSMGEWMDLKVEAESAFKVLERGGPQAERMMRGGRR